MPRKTHKGHIDYSPSMEPEIVRLMTFYGDSQIGDLIPHADVAEVSGEPYRTDRYWSIVVGWKARMFDEHNICLANVRGVGYRVLDGAGRIGMAVQTQRLGLQRMARGAEVAAHTATEDLTQEARRGREHVMKVHGLIQTALQNAKMQLPPARPTRSISERAGGTPAPADQPEMQQVRTA